MRCAVVYAVVFCAKRPQQRLVERLCDPGKYNETINLNKRTPKLSDTVTVTEKSHQCSVPCTHGVNATVSDEVRALSCPL